jgi:hypothetical protein
MAMGIFGTMISNLNQMGFYDFVLPWLLIFAVVYAILKKSKVLDNEQADGIVSVVVAFFATAFTGSSIGTFFTNLFGGGAIFLAAILIFLIFVGLFGFDMKTITDQKEMLIIPAGIVILLFLSMGGLETSGISLSGDVFSALVMVGIVALGIIFVTKN